MIRYLTTILFALVTTCFSAFGQSNSCKITIVRLKLPNDRPAEPTWIANNDLARAQPSGSILLGNSEISDFAIKSDTVPGESGTMVFSSHLFTVDSQAAAQLSKIDIPLCCGIPVVLYVGEKELYRGMLWNVFSSFSNESLTMTLVQNTIIVRTALSAVDDSKNASLVNENSLPQCLLKK